MTSLSTPRPSSGLTTSESVSRLAQFGPNIIGGSQRRAVIFEFLYHFRNPLVLILLVAGVFSAITGDTTSFVIIITIVLAGVILDFVQEHRASRAAEKLSESVALQSRVIRDGKESRFPRKASFPVTSSCSAPAISFPPTAQILESRDFFVNEAMLTGEPYPVEKSAAGEADKKLAFMGSSVMSGSARILVAKTGAATSVGQIAKSLNKATPPTAFELGARQFGMMIMRLTVMLVLFVVLVNAISHKPFFESFLFAVALAVGSHAGTIADGRVGDAGKGRAAHGRQACDRQKTFGDSRPGKHGRALHRQDRNAHRSAYPARAPRRCGWKRQRARPGTRIHQQLL